ncbi:ferredoxin [Amycolatopsis nalaikhensis]|uniref:Ferredoxin n=1 Tax=Amycolatopsis nalaikhensis TaxID=715472 RepID=A0ABY8XTZ8_9PSEU|nr:ferredoxin [Amycolatopsis sp. 2-2]WIV59136.1 ferredoxin [Amycolatopsis sp. 2-2]
MPWVFRGLRDGVVTTGYPRRPDDYAETGVRSLAQPRQGARWEPGLDALCPTGAISEEHGAPRLDQGRCIGCGACVAARPDTFTWQTAGATARLTRRALVVPELPETDGELRALRHRLSLRTKALRRSVHIRHVDAGSDGSEEWEVLALLNPVYDVHRLGIFFTASPRHADILLVTGVGTHGMAAPLARTLQALPRPLVVIAAGTDAISGGLVCPSYAGAGGIGEQVPVDVWVPGSPPSPFSLLHAILLATGRLPGTERAP